MGGTVYHNRVKLRCLSNTWGHGHEDVATIEVMAHASVALREGKEMGMRIPYTREGERPMRSYKLLTLTCGVSVLLLGSLVLLARAQSVAQSDIDLARQEALVLAAAHSEQPRYGGTFLSAGNEEVPFYDLHQTSLGGIFAAGSPAYSCLIRTSPYDPESVEILPELADS